MTSTTEMALTSSTSSATFEGLNLLVSAPKKLKKRRDNSGVDIHLANIQVVLPDNRRCPLVIETPVLESNGIFAFNEEKTGHRRCIVIQGGACVWLEQVLRFLSDKAFPLLVQKVKNATEKVPSFCRRITQPGATVSDCVRDDFAGEGNEEGSHWFKLSPECRIFDIDNGNTLLGVTDDTDLPKGGLYKLRIRISAFYLGNLGSSCTKCCSLLAVVDQVAVRPQALEAPPKELVLNIDEFDATRVPFIAPTIGPSAITGPSPKKIDLDEEDSEDEAITGPSPKKKALNEEDSEDDILTALDVPQTITDEQFEEASQAIAALERQATSAPPKRRKQVSFDVKKPKKF